MITASLAALADLVLPQRCIGCARPGSVWCRVCLPRGPAFRVDGSSVAVAAAAEYGGSVRAAVVAYKERGRRDLVAPLALLLHRAVLLTLAGAWPRPPGTVVLIPVPSSRRAAASRGGDHVQRLLRVVAPAVGCRMLPDVLWLSRAVRDSAGLGRAERAHNLDRAMRAGPVRGPASAVLVDDVVTTGATLRESARALSAAGWPVLGAAAIAATPARGAGRPGGVAAVTEGERVAFVPLVTHSRRV